MRGILVNSLTRRAFLALAITTAVASPASIVRAETPSHAVRLALHGYDPVSYFTEGHPEQGVERLSVSFDDAVYWFASEQHRAMFIANPDAYAPQYKGFCAISVSRNMIAEPDPKAWAISDGKLYVFSSPAWVARFEQDKVAILAQGAENWPELQNRL
jgi:YHS domain-containing protein